MEKELVNVKLVGKKGDRYEILFPNLNVPVSINENLYRKMQKSTMFRFNQTASPIENSYP
ncbi:hypothetical protein ED312_04615 [Sinomicrobium pectinilyticum]|uniref:Uncharacterized protein n=1 Tax=Sinomicrobium pectinilyticum TaxID=1084421 RepID=A0A3N0EUC4_SINP1|nr:hypothetical protein [Sinomicrobium pectinilyticum]RNL91456.1 hypothetical protein ED312_04615 [Sinomicrobium pectinilyticum]